MSNQLKPGRSVKAESIVRIKNDVLDDPEDTVSCKFCYKGFASQIALNNHARVEHIEAYATGDPQKWTQLIANVKKEIESKEIWVHARDDANIPDLKPTSMTNLASQDVSYIIIKNNDLPPHIRKKRGRVKKKEEKVVKEKPAVNLTGPFECLEPSNEAEDGICHKIFHSCCEYSIHYRDGHTRRRKALRCQVCEKPLVCNGADPLTPFTCEVCGESFENNKDLYKHASTAHVKLKPYECQLCLKRFTKPGGLHQHMKMHSGDRPYSCNFCRKTFTQKSGLGQHIRIHTNDRPYKCILCSKAFSQSIHMKQHMRTHTQVAPFQCGFCDKRFKQASHLNCHLKNHNPANMSEKQRAEYSELIGVLAKNYVKVEIERMEDSEQEIELDNEETEIDNEETEFDNEDAEIDNDEEKVIVEEQEVWIEEVMN